MSSRSGPKGRELKKRNTTALTPLRDRKARDALLKSIDVAEVRRRVRLGRKKNKSNSLANLYAEGVDPLTG